MNIGGSMGGGNPYEMRRQGTADVESGNGNGGNFKAFKGKGQRIG